MSAALKDFSSVSPSAKSLGMMKGYTDIPYAREMAALMQGSEVFDLNFDDKALSTRFNVVICPLVVLLEILSYPYRIFPRCARRNLRWFVVA